MKIKDIKSEIKRLEEEIENLPKAKFRLEVITVSGDQNLILEYDIKHCFDNDDKAFSTLLWEHSKSCGYLIESDNIKKAALFINRFKGFVTSKYLEVNGEFGNFNHLAYFNEVVSITENIQNHTEKDKLWRLVDTMNDANLEIVKQILS